jgi:hypothetical protein
VVDLDALDRNIAAMAGDIAALGAAWRPHTKAVKTPAIAHKELAAGAIGVTVAKLAEAEVMAEAGIRDILIAKQNVVGSSPITRSEKTPQRRGIRAGPIGRLVCVPRFVQRLFTAAPAFTMPGGKEARLRRPPWHLGCR